MNKALFFLLAVSILPLYGSAQVPSIHENLAFSQEFPREKQSSAPHIIWRELLENRGTSSIVAFHANFNCQKLGNALFDHDPFFNYGDDVDIPPGGSVEIIAADPSRCSGGVVAAIFSDGHSEGDPKEVNNLYARRRGVYTALGESMKLLDLIATQEQTPKQIRDILESRAKALSYDQTIDGYERLGMIVTYSKLRATLQSTRAVIHAPSDYTTHRQPFCYQLAKSQNISLEQAQAIVIGKKIQEWRADLQGNMESPTKQ
jgi:hypothetical protein